MKVSVVIPAFNSEKTLGACLAALQNQTVPADSVEIIVIDDGSTDNTPKIAREHNVRYVFQANRGPAAARNHGARLATGEFLLFTDADCEPLPDWIEQMIKPFDDPEIVAVKGAYLTRQTHLAPRFAQQEFEDRYDLLETAKSIDMVDTYSAAFRRTVFNEMNGFDESFPKANNEDTELSYRLVDAGHKLAFNRQALVYHTHPDTLRKYLRIKFTRGYWRIVVYRRFPGKAVRDSYTPAVIKIQTLLAAASFAAIPVGMVFPWLFFAPFALWIAILATAVPFARKAYCRDPGVALAAPFIVLLRALVFAAGSLLGLVSGKRS
jgi:glycosyltransferase involved in cell wall biosynthesis